MIAPVLAILMVGLLPVLATSVASAEEPTRLQQGDGEVIDITGFMEWPRGDTSLTWTRPESFKRDTDLVFGLALKDEVFRPVDRDNLKRTMAVQRALGQIDRSDRSDPLNR
jgi:hypothetical protein